MSHPEALSHLERGQLISGKYRLRRPLDAGGMGAVWVAHHEDLGIDVAVKFVQPDVRDHERSLSRFRREARAAARLKSPHTAQILDYGIDGDLPYIAMELLEGHHLGIELERHAPMPPARVAELIGQAAKGLAEAHDAGIVHRDVKPANLYLARVAGEELVKVLDFGIAKVLFADATGEHVATETGTLLGSPRYMSPEQASGDPVDHRSDLFSLAAVAFEALTGRRLFTATHLGSLVLQVTKARVPPLETVRPGLPPELDAFFVQALAVNPDVRFRDARSFAEALRSACAGEDFGLADEDTADGVQPDLASVDLAAVTAGDTRGFDDPQAETATTSVSNAVPASPKRARWPVALALLGLGGVAAWWSMQGGAAAPEPAVPAPAETSAATRPTTQTTAVAAALATATATAASSASSAPAPAPVARPIPSPVARPTPQRAPATHPAPSLPAGDGIFDPRPRKKVTPEIR